MVHTYHRLLDKRDVDYTNKGSKQEHCSICEHYESYHTCEIVAGEIAPTGWCDHFARRHE